MSDGNVGEILSDQGYLDEAESHLLRARRVFKATDDRQWIAYADALLGRLAVRRGQHRDGISVLEGAMSNLRRLGMEAYAELAQSWIAEAEALGGDPMRAMEIASRQLRANEMQRPLLTRMAGVALARLGQKEAAVRELRHSLRTARERSADYDIAATIDAMDVIESVDGALRRERDEILERLKIIQLQRPVLAAGIV